MNYSLKLSFSFFTQLLTSFLLCKTESNTMNTIKKRLSPSVKAQRHAEETEFLERDQGGRWLQPGGGYDCRLFTSLFSAATGDSE